MRKVETVQRRFETDLTAKAQVYAVDRHTSINQLYAGLPYSFHLGQAVDFAFEFIDLLTEEEAEIVISATWLHDTMEDTGATYNNIKNEFGIKIADVVYNLTNEKGKDRKERAVKTYPGIAACKLSVYTKNSDRLANTNFSFESGSSMYRKYKGEYPYYKEVLYNKEHGFDRQWTALDIANSR
jgi:(p)ppGpp synthase/HD superfamily hydrolase